MLFNSVQFMVFLPIVVLLYYLIPTKGKQIWLLLASYFFYMCWNAKFLLLILASTVITYMTGLLMEKVRDGRKENRAKALLAGCISINLLILFYFKYANFFVSLLASGLALLHIHLQVPQWDILLPVGISFYTFQAIGYTIDVYRNEVKAEHNFITYALFVSFFPQLVAGPIERSGNLLGQLKENHRFDAERARDGILLMIWGFFLKIVLADRIAVFVDTVYNDTDTFGGMFLIVATVLFAFQIYCDFYGYSTIAVGAAKILDIRLMENFKAPYLSVSVAEFWRNWHISLTSWFKDYLYIPLGGSRKGTVRKHLNKLIVFMVSGLWHGASITFVIWGGLNGLYQIIGEVLMPVRKKVGALLKVNEQSFSHHLLKGLVTFVLVDFSWIFFRANNVQQAFVIIQSMVTKYNPWVLVSGGLYRCGLDQKNFNLMLFALVILGITDFCKKRNVVIRQFLMKQDQWFRWCVFALSIFFVLVFGIWGPAYDAQNFIYFQF